MEGKGGGEVSRGLGVGVGAALLAKSPSFELHHGKGGGPLNPLDHLQPPLGKAGAQPDPHHHLDPASKDKHRLDPLPSPLGKLGALGEQHHLPDVARPRVHWSSNSPSVGIASAATSSPDTPPEPRPQPPDITARTRVHWSAAAPSPASSSPLLQPLQVPRPGQPHARDSPLARSPRSPSHRAAMGVGAGVARARQDSQQPDVTKRGHHHHQHHQQDKHH